MQDAVAPVGLQVPANTPTPLRRECMACSSQFMSVDLVADEYVEGIEGMKGMEGMGMEIDGIVTMSGVIDGGVTRLEYY